LTRLAKLLCRQMQPGMRITDSRHAARRAESVTTLPRTCGSRPSRGIALARGRRRLHPGRSALVRRYSR
jgi:hypothetical protein